MGADAHAQLSALARETDWTQGEVLDWIIRRAASGYGILGYRYHKARLLEATDGPPSARRRRQPPARQILPTPPPDELAPRRNRREREEELTQFRARFWGLDEWERSYITRGA